MARVTRSMSRGVKVKAEVVKEQKEVVKSTKKKVSSKSEVKEVIVKKKVVKPKPIPISYLKETDVEVLKLIDSLPKEPSMEFVLDYLCKADKELKSVLEKSDKDCFIFNYEKIALGLEGVPDTFRYLARNIIYQQLTGKAAKVIENRFITLFKKGDSDDLFFPTPEQVYTMDNETLRGVGLSTGKTSYIKDLARHYKEGILSDEKLKIADDKTVYEMLIQVKGIGPWTIDIFLMSYLKRLDVLPVGDLGIKKGMVKHFQLEVKDKKKLISEADMLELSKNWRPYRSVASWLMWEIANTITTESK